MLLFLLCQLIICYTVCAQKNKFCESEICQPGYTPYDNMVAGLTGYDPVFSDPLDSNGDPGLKLQILQPTKELQDGTHRVTVPPYINVQDDIRYCRNTCTRGYQKLRTPKNIELMASNFFL
jgi:hypothetical protein